MPALALVGDLLMPLTTTGKHDLRERTPTRREESACPTGSRQAKAVLANTSGTNPRHRKARKHAKMAMKKKRGNGMMPSLREIASPGVGLAHANKSATAGAAASAVP